MNRRVLSYIIIIMVFSISVVGAGSVGGLFEYEWDYDFDGDIGDVEDFEKLNVDSSYSSNVYHYSTGADEPPKYDGDEVVISEGVPENSLLLKDESILGLRTGANRTNDYEFEFIIYPETKTFDPLRIDFVDRYNSFRMKSLYLGYEGSENGFVFYDDTGYEIHSFYHRIGNEDPLRFIARDFDYINGTFEIDFWDEMESDMVTDELIFENGGNSILTDVQLRVLDMDDYDYETRYHIDYMRFDMKDESIEFGDGEDEYVPFDDVEIDVGREGIYSVGVDDYKIVDVSSEFIGHYDDWDTSDLNDSSEGYNIDYEIEVKGDYFSYRFMETNGYPMNLVRFDVIVDADISPSSDENSLIYEEFNVTVSSDQHRMRKSSFTYMIDETITFDLNNLFFGVCSSFDIEYYINWDDGHVSGWIDDDIVQHVYERSGIKNVRVDISDDFGMEERYYLSIYVDDYNETTNATPDSGFDLLNTDVSVDHEYEVLSDGSSNDWLRRNIFKEKIVWRIEPNVNLDDNDVSHISFAPSYFDRNTSDMIDDSLLWTDIIIRIERDESPGYVYIEDLEGVESEIEDDVFHMFVEGDWEYIEILYNPSSYDKIMIFFETLLMIDVDSIFVCVPADKILFFGGV